MGKMLEILCFGPAREATGSQRLQFLADLPCRVDELRQRLLENYPGLGSDDTLRIAVDQSYADDDLLINGGEEIALVMPVSGG